MFGLQEYVNFILLRPIFAEIFAKSRSKSRSISRSAMPIALVLWHCHYTHPSFLVSVIDRTILNFVHSNPNSTFSSHTNIFLLL